jgi:hypothetical protein
MLDVHAPHSRIGGFSEFFVHLLTITIGLIIATQIESCVEWRHHEHLAEQARQALHSEIEHNLGELRSAQPGLKSWEAAVEADLAAMHKIQQSPNDPAAQKANLEISANGITLRDAAWHTAQSTGALAYMPYEEAERYSSIYQAQTVLMTYQQKPPEDVAAIFGLIAKFGWGNGSKILPDQAGAIAEKLGQMRLHLAAGETYLDECIELSDAYLNNRAPKQEFGTRLDAK